MATSFAPSLLEMWDLFQALCVRADEALRFLLVVQFLYYSNQSEFLLPIPESPQSACDKLAIPSQRETRSFTPGPAISNFLHPFSNHQIYNLYPRSTHARLVLSLTRC